MLVLGFIVLFADASRSLVQPLSNLHQPPISLDPSDLPGYALRTALRMLIAMVVSLLFTFTYATWAAKSPRAGTLLVPLLDILQSVPILSLSVGDRGVLPVAGAGAGPGRGIRRDFRHFHQPGLEHGVQLLPVAAHGARPS